MPTLNVRTPGTARASGGIPSQRARPTSLRDVARPLPRERQQRRPSTVSFSERRTGTATVLVLLSLIVIGLVIGVVFSAAMLTLARHSGLDPAGPGQHGDVLSRTAWQLSR